MKRKFAVAIAMAALLAATSVSYAAETASADQQTKTNEASTAIEEITGSNTKPAQKVEAKSEDQAPAAAEQPKNATTVTSQTAPVSTDTPTVETTPAPAPVAPAATPALEGRPIKPSAMQPGDPETEESLLVTPEWLKKHKNEVIIVDSRPASLYAGGHIAGAVNATWTYFANTTAPSGSMKYGTVYNSVTMAKRIGALGINGKKTVVAYCDAGGWGQSGWTVWVLRMCGIKNAKILDGGLSGWKKIGGAVSRVKHSNKAVAFSVKSYKSNYLVNTEWINNNIGKPGLVLLDVRTEPEYLGNIRPFSEKRAGHLPTAINIEMAQFVTPTHNFVEEQEIIDKLAAHGITPENEIVVYDTAGVRAAFVTMALRYAGFNKSQCYDEGFQAWAGKSDLPLEK